MISSLSLPWPVAAPEPEGLRDPDGQGLHPLNLWEGASIVAIVHCPIHNSQTAAIKVQYTQAWAVYSLCIPKRGLFG